jgi:hypothetical protein
LGIFRNFKTCFISAVVSAAKLFDVRDLFVFGGLSMLGYGLYLKEPWIAFSVCGALLIALGLGWLTRIADHNPAPTGRQ